jgi:hypothetical protein
MRPGTRIAVLLVFFFVAGSLRLSAGVALLVGEPYGKFGALSPLGHAAIYLSGICAETPTFLRICRPGESGTVISRYGGVAGFDWVAIPLLPYLYAVERPEDVPKAADKTVTERLREGYRREHLRELVPDAPRGEMPKGGWIQLVGSAYDRHIYGFALETTPADDERLIQYLNSHRNRRKFNLIWRNCADFARQILNFYYPDAVGRNIIGDLGIMTPKHAAKSLVKYSQRRPNLRFTHFAVAQIPGGRSSTRIRGVSESLIRSKKYVVPLVVFQPWVAASAAMAYLFSGRFDPGRYSPVHCESLDVAACMTGAEFGGQQPLQTDAAKKSVYDGLDPTGGVVFTTTAEPGKNAEAEQGIHVRE